MKNLLLIALLFSFHSTFAQESYFATGSDPRAKIDLSPNKPVQRYFPLTLVSINGDKIINLNDVVWLKPGTYSLILQQNVNQSFVSQGGRTFNANNNQKSKSDRLEITVEADKTYQLAYDASSHKMEDWKPKVLKVYTR